jgi:nicotinate-nucleotide adenylyltransferase
MRRAFRPAGRSALASALGGSLPGPGRRIGLFGGSFNPPHAGHLAVSLAALKRLRVSALEAVLGTRYTVDTLAALGAAFPGTRFVWLMGADGFAELPRWHAWPRLFALAPIAVFDRPSYSLRALAGPAAQRFRRARLAEGGAARLAETSPPAWVFIHLPLSPLSSTGLRGEAGAGST